MMKCNEIIYEDLTKEDTVSLTPDLSLWYRQ